MPDTFDQNELRRLAAAGVRLEIARLTSLAEQLETPLKGTGRPSGSSFKRPLQSAPANGTSRKRMSAAARKAISERMKARWASIKKSKA